MTKRRDRIPRARVEAPPSTPMPMIGIDIAAMAVAALCAALAWAARGNLNVDGAAYLDLASRIATGDGAGFVQGYWSPLYPMLLAPMLMVTGASGSAAISVAHGLNLIIALAAVGLLWHEARRHRGVLWGVVALTAFLVASARTVRIDAVTPDLLLMVAMIGLALELLRPGGWRAGRLGAWAGAAFLVKTSIWPWLMVASLVGMFVLRAQPAHRRKFLGAVTIAAIPLVLWSAAISIEEGRPTVGSTGRLGACWYLFSCDGRSPDSHEGEHREYHRWLLGAEAQAKVATFPGTQWTYAPWSDPSAWQRGVLTQERRWPTVTEFVVYSAKQLGLVLGIWLAFLIVGVLLPTLFATRDAPSLRTTARSPSGAAMLLGLLGMLQFVAVHAEPRLIAPFAMLLALGWITWRLSGTPRRGQWPLAVIGLVVALAVGTWHLGDQALVTASSQARTLQLERSHLPMSAPHRVAVIGPALPMMPDLYRARAVVVAQVMQPDPAALASWSPAGQAALADRLRSLGATALWISRGREAYRIVPLAPAPRP